MTIPDNLEDILARIAAARKAAVSPAPTTRLVAVSKTVAKEGIRAALAAGQRCRRKPVQEAQAKFPALKSEHSDLELHLIGPLQDQQGERGRRAVRRHPDAGRVKLADALAAERDKSGNARACSSRVNTGEEPQKAGVPPREALALIAYTREKNLPLEGLMCIPPADDDAAPHFALLHETGARS